MALKLKVCQAINQAPSVRAGCIEQAANMVLDGMSAARLRSLYDGYMRTRDWRTLLNKAKAGATWWDTEDRVKLPMATIEYWRTLCERNQRKCRPAYRVLVAQYGRWQRGDASAAIPGFATCPPPDPRTRLPRGMTYANLMRSIPSQYELAVSRVGRSAGDAHRPLVYTTRANLWCGSHYMFDDLWHDHMVNVLDTAKTGRPLEFHGLDLFSACKIGWGMKVRTRSDETGKMEGLKEHMMRMLLVQVLSDHGYSERGTILVVEHGTAAVREDLERQLHDLTGGLITVSRSGMSGDPALTGQYPGRAKGNYRFKAALETLGNLIHNEMAMLPGQTGMDVDHRPEELHGLLKHNDALLAAMVGLALTAPDRAALLQFDLLEFRQFVDLAVDIYRRINERTHHELEGWQKHVVADGYGRMRRMSPSEVWAAGRQRLTRIQPAVSAMLLGPDIGVERVVRRGMFEVTDKEISADVMRYDAAQLIEGERYMAVINPFAPGTLFAFDAKGRFVAPCSRIERADRGDWESLKRALGFAAKREAELLAAPRARGMEVAANRLDRARHNAEVLSGIPKNERSKAIANERSHLVGSQGAQAAEDLLASSPEQDDGGSNTDTVGEFLADIM